MLMSHAPMGHVRQAPQACGIQTLPASPPMRKSRSHTEGPGTCPVGAQSVQVTKTKAGLSCCHRSQNADLACDSYAAKLLGQVRAMRGDAGDTEWRGATLSWACPCLRLRAGLWLRVKRLSGSQRERWGMRCCFCLLCDPETPSLSPDPEHVKAQSGRSGERPCENSGEK